MPGLLLSFSNCGLRPIRGVEGGGGGGLRCVALRYSNVLTNQLITARAHTHSSLAGTSGLIDGSHQGC